VSGTLLVLLLTLLTAVWILFLTMSEHLCFEIIFMDVCYGTNGTADNNADTP
jgi:hypothetical protein